MHPTGMQSCFMYFFEKIGKSTVGIQAGMLNSKTVKSKFHFIQLLFINYLKVNNEKILRFLVTSPTSPESSEIFWIG